MLEAGNGEFVIGCAAMGDDIVFVRLLRFLVLRDLALPAAPVGSKSTPDELAEYMIGILACSKLRSF